MRKFVHIVENNFGASSSKSGAIVVVSITKEVSLMRCAKAPAKLLLK
jgi:hypothetical protein